MAGVNVAKIQNQKPPAFALGGDFETNGPQHILVGDNPGGRERVQVTPLSSPNINGPKQPMFSIGGDTIVINGNADESTVAGFQQVKEEQLNRLRQNIIELMAAGQMPAGAM